MRILFVSGFAYLPQRYGGAERSIDALARELTRQNHEVAVFSKLNNSGLTGIISRFRRKLLSEKPPKTQYKSYTVFRTWNQEEYLPKAIRVFKPDVVILQHGQPLRFAPAAQNAGVPLVLHLRDADFSNLGGDPRAQNLSGVISNSNFISKQFKATFGLDSIVVRNIISSNDYYTLRRPYYATFISPHKNKGVEMMFKIAQNNPKIPFLFVEGWPLPKPIRAEYISRIQALPNVRWSRTQSDMRNIYKRTRLLLAPSQVEEAWGRVVSEAQICGIPCIASDRGGLPEAVGDGGVVLPHDDCAIWNYWLREIWNSPQILERLSIKAKNNIIQLNMEPAPITSFYLETLNGFLKANWK